MNIREMIATFVFIGVVVILAATNFTSLVGGTLGYLESNRLKRVGADSRHVNPPAQEDAFNGGQLSTAWKHAVLNGNGEIGQVPRFHVTDVVLSDGSLEIWQTHDPDFDAKQDAGFGHPDAGKQYNNAAIIGFDGYQPTPAEDLLLECEMSVSANFFGSSGCIFEPSSTLRADGTFQDGRFTFFGVSFLGEGSTLRGYSGAIVNLAVNWWPQTVRPLIGIDPRQPHTYTIRLRWENERLWVGTVYVDGKEMSKAAMPPLGPVEVQIWSDNYVLSNPGWGAPAIGYGNGEQFTRFTRIAVWTEAR
jgi:hypothetical protein